MVGSQDVSDGLERAYWQLDTLSWRYFGVFCWQIELWVRWNHGSFVFYQEDQQSSRCIKNIKWTFTEMIYFRYSFFTMLAETAVFPHTFWCIFVYVLIEMSSLCTPWYNWSFVQIISWCRTNDKSLPEQMMIHFTGADMPKRTNVLLMC